MTKQFTLAAILVLIPCASRAAEPQNRDREGAAAFQVNGADARPWTKILGSVGISRVDTNNATSDSAIVIAGSTAQPGIAALAETRLLILEGASPAAHSLGIVAKTETVAVRQIRDTHAPGMQIFWEQPSEIAVMEIPADFQVFATERWKNAPVIAGKRTPHGAVLWIATSPGASGIERYPYLLQALVDLGLELRVGTTNLWAFFDSSYRIRADVDYLARRWRQTGTSVLHVAAWHNMEPDAAQDEYLKKLIEACHRHAILVYAWIELPHVSEKFWADHPRWREQTAAGQDAQLDWRKLKIGRAHV